MNWTEEKLNELPTSGMFRMRGEDMTRVEVFSDAAFAFAVTMLVISLSSIPKNYGELIEALKGAPAFAASFAQIMVFWVGHRRWSRRYGLNDGVSMLITLGMIFVVLIYVYPLKLMMTSFLNFASGGWFPSNFHVSGPSEIAGLMVIYGIGCFAISGILMALYLLANAQALKLNLNAVERIMTHGDIAIWSIHAGVGLLSAFVSWILPEQYGPFGGFVYFILPFTIPFVVIHYNKKAKRVA